MKSGEAYQALERVKRDDRTVLTVGFFDGVHLGHRSVLCRVRDAARELGARSVMVTFDRPPRSVLQGNPVPLLTTLDEKAAIAHSLGLTDVVVISFDRSFAELDAEAFVHSVLVNRIGLTKIILGYDHRFGKGGTGNVDTMRKLGDKFGFDVEVVSEQTTGEGAYSSTRIREILVSSGNVEKAARHLGRYHALEGEVVHGDGRGRTIGFPTANLELLNRAKVVPAVGVYAVFLKLGGETRWRHGIMNIGYRPTVTDATERVSEVHLLDFDGDLYGKTMRVAFVSRIRDERRFEGVEALVTQIRRDVVRCETALEAVSLPD